MNMNVQSCSVDVPGTCPNKCKCCVSQLSKTKKFLKNMFTDDCSIDSTGFKEYRDRLAYVREKTDTVILTGTASEPVFNMKFIDFFDSVNKSLPQPFYNIEIQSSGIGLDNDKLAHLKKIGVKTIALSIFSMDSDVNNNIQQSPAGLRYDIAGLCARIKLFNFNLRLCFNLNNEGFGYGTNPKQLTQIMLNFAKEVDADQVTFRKLYHDMNVDAPETKWVIENQLNHYFWSNLKAYIVENGEYKRTLDYGAKLYTVIGMSIVIDYDCMAKDNDKALKYLIIRRNFKIYSDWDDEGSLVF